MIAALTLTLVCVALSLALGSLIRCRLSLRHLQADLHAATLTERAKDSLLTERSARDTAKDEFLCTVSHELRTPLTSIRGALGLLSAGPLCHTDPRAQNLLRIALTNTDRLIRLTTDILDLERMNSGHTPLQLRRCSLLELARQSVETMDSMAETAGIAVEIVLAAPATSVFFNGDPDRIVQVLTNLLSNAIKFSPSPGAVALHIEANADSVLLRVSDRGRGIPPDMLNSVFDRFHQVEPADAHRQNGAGLGLSICKSIVQQHNGSIWAESNLHRDGTPGTSLFVSLPRVSRSDDTLASEPVSILSGRARATIIACNPDAATRHRIADHLQQQGFVVLHAGTALQALELCLSAAPDLLLLDPAFPGTDASSLLAELRRHPSLRDLPLLVHSTRKLSHRERAGLRLGPTHFLAGVAAQPQILEDAIANLLLPSSTEFPSTLLIRNELAGLSLPLTRSA